MGFLKRMLGRAQQNLCGIPPRRVQTESNHEETTAKPADGVLQTNWPVLFKDVSVMKERRRDYFRSEGAKETRQQCTALFWIFVCS